MHTSLTRTSTFIAACLLISFGPLAAQVPSNLGMLAQDSFRKGARGTDSQTEFNESPVLLHPWIKDCGLVLLVDTGATVQIEAVKSYSNRPEHSLIRDRLLARDTARESAGTIASDGWVCLEIPFRLSWSDNPRDSYLGPKHCGLSLRVAISGDGQFQLGTQSEMPQEHLLTLTLPGGIDNYRDFEGNVLSEDQFRTPHNARLDTDEKQNLLADWFEDLYCVLRRNGLLSHGPTNGAELYACPTRLFNLFSRPITVVHARIHHQQFDYYWYPEELRTIDEAMNRAWSPIAREPDQNTVLRLAFDLRYDSKREPSAIFLRAMTDNRNASRYRVSGLLVSDAPLVSRQGSDSKVIRDPENGVCSGVNQDICASTLLLYDQSPFRIELEAATRWSVVQPFCRYARFGNVSMQNCESRPSGQSQRLIVPHIWVVEPAVKVTGGVIASRQTTMRSHQKQLDAGTNVNHQDSDLSVPTIISPVVDWPQTSIAHLFGDSEVAQERSSGETTRAQLQKMLGGFDIANAELVLKALRDTMRWGVYPQNKYPNGHPDLAMCDAVLGYCRLFQGDSPGAKRYFEKARGMIERLRNAGNASQSLEETAIAIDFGDGISHLMYGEQSKALPIFKNILPNVRKLYPTPAYPRGHIGIVFALQMVAVCEIHGGQYDEADRHLTEAVEMLCRLQPSERFVLGDILEAISLEYLAALNHERGELQTAEQYYADAISAFRNLQQGVAAGPSRTALASALFFYGRLLKESGRFDEAIERFAEAETLFASGKDFSGIVTAAVLTSRLHGETLVLAGRAFEAVTVLERSLREEKEVLANVLCGASEAEAFNFLERNRDSLDALLSCWLDTDRPIENLYRHVWDYQAVVFRATSLRQRLAVADQGEEIRGLYERYLKVRQELARQALASSTPDLFAQLRRQNSLKGLANAKESLEHQLAEALPDFRRRLSGDGGDPQSLIDKLPQNAALIDYIRYTDPTSRGPMDAYMAFVLAPNAGIHCIPLGPAEPIDELVQKWRSDITRSRSSTAAAELRKRVWDPVESEFTTHVKSVYIHPAGSLGFIPFAAFPTPGNDSRLLEHYAFATVPGGSLLLQELEKGKRKKAKREVLLAVAAVDYGTPASTSARNGVPYAPLPGTSVELEIFQDYAADNKSCELFELTGTLATNREVLTVLPATTYAHFATHGYFIPASLRPEISKDNEEDLVGRRLFGVERSGTRGRNPLILSGLVLAGANREDSRAGAMLSAEAIAGLSLPAMELVVLSACGTGLGDIAEGEGVLGLQRGFHLAGARNVIASLWSVDDYATAALMKSFYYSLWVEGKPPIQALNEAQLAIYRNPGSIKELAQSRGVELESIIRHCRKSGPDFTHPETLPAEASRVAPTRLWAAFVLSGAGT